MNCRQKKLRRQFVVGFITFGQQCHFNCREGLGHWVSCECEIYLVNQFLCMLFMSCVRCFSNISCHAHSINIPRLELHASYIDNNSIEALVNDGIIPFLVFFSMMAHYLNNETGRAT